MGARERIRTIVSKIVYWARIELDAHRVLAALSKSPICAGEVSLSDLDVGLSVERAQHAWNYLKRRQFIDCSENGYLGRINATGVRWLMSVAVPRPGFPAITDPWVRLEGRARLSADGSTLRSEADPDVHESLTAVAVKARAE